ncbi:MAG: peptide-methionine (S)-S-oxide reductase MsrA [Saprospiraceae bacterium]
MQNLSLATLGGGCFWCVEAIFEQVQGVHSATSGYSGDDEATADYKTVCTGTTRHAEVVQVAFDPAVISYQEILEIFFTTHDPTTLNRQGNDKGPQYRSVVFYHDQEQLAIAQRVMTDYAPQVWDDPIVTELAPFEAFYPAEDYHHGYYGKVGERNPYCTFVITPKVSKFRKLFAHRLK